MSKIRLLPYSGGKILFNERVRVIDCDWDRMAKMELLTGESLRVIEQGKTDKDAEPGYYSIHSSWFGTEWGDDKAFEDMWSCECGTYMGKFYADKGFVCPKCNKPVMYVGADMSKHMWIILDNDEVIQPHLYRKLEVFIGVKVLEDILDYRSVYEDDRQRGEPLSPFSKIGMIGFKNRFDEIMGYFFDKKKKKDLYIYLMVHRDEIFVHSIPVYSALMRHFIIKDGKVKYTDDDKIYKRLFTNSELLNNEFILADKTNNASKRSGMKGVERLRRENILYKMQVDIMKLWEFCFYAIDGKDGVINGNVIAGRMDYTARNVIIPDPTLRMDEIDIGYITALEEFKLEFIDVTHQIQGISHKAAFNIWREATMDYNPRVHRTLTHILNTTPRITSIYRNPSINYGSEEVCRIRRITPGINDYCMALSPNVLIKPNADFDGDVMAQIYHKIGEISEEYYKRLNPRSNFMIDRNTGKFDNDSNLFKDQAVLLHAILNI